MPVTTGITSPQPLGVFGFPAGFLLISDSVDPAVVAAHEELLAGRLPTIWPEALTMHRLVHEDRIAEALAAITADSPIDDYHRWLLGVDVSQPALRAIRDGLPPAYRGLVDVVATLRVHLPGPPAPPAPPEPPEPAEPAAGAAEPAREVQALVLAATASAQAASDPAGAVKLMLAAADVAGTEELVALAAVLRGNAGLMQGADGAPALAEAVAGLAQTDLGDVRAELLLALGSLLQERAAARATEDSGELLQQAMGHYYEALTLVSEESDPGLWASLNLNLATAQLAVPMAKASDQLRLGVATQALRSARRVFTRETAPAQWASATLNLANALVYVPSTHQADNLVEAAGLYDEILESGIRANDPLGRARLLTNQGNVLAHLGVFDEARAKLAEARFLFEEHLDHDGAMTVRSILDEIRKAGVTDPDDELADLARQSEQMSRMPQSEAAFSSGMGVQISGAGSPDLLSGSKPKVQRVDPASRPTRGAES